MAGRAVHGERVLADAWATDFVAFHSTAGGGSFLRLVTYPVFASNVATICFSRIV